MNKENRARVKAALKQISLVVKEEGWENGYEFQQIRAIYQSPDDLVHWMEEEE